MIRSEGYFHSNNFLFFLESLVIFGESCFEPGCGQRTDSWSSWKWWLQPASTKLWFGLHQVCTPCFKFPVSARPLQDWSTSFSLPWWCERLHWQHCEHLHCFCRYSCTMPCYISKSTVLRCLSVGTIGKCKRINLMLTILQACVHKSDVWKCEINLWLRRNSMWNQTWLRQTQRIRPGIQANYSGQVWNHSNQKTLIKNGF